MSIDHLTYVAKEKSVLETFRNASPAEKRVEAQRRDKACDHLRKRAEELAEKVDSAHGTQAAIVSAHIAGTLMWVDNPDLRGYKAPYQEHVVPYHRMQQNVQDMLDIARKRKSEARQLRWSARRGETMSMIKKVLHLG